MKSFTFLSLLSLAAIAAGPSGSKPLAVGPVHGEYVEARTASVFAGPCHYNAELMTTGRDAVLAWEVTGGSFKGVDLTGMRVMAAVSSSDSLGNTAAGRRCELLVDSSASTAQADAWVSLVKSKWAADLGTISAVRRGSITISHEGAHRSVSAVGFGSIAIDPMPNGECCKQPNLVWFTPIIPLQSRKVGYTTEAAYSAGTLGDRWDRGDENSAFYGSFQF